MGLWTNTLMLATLLCVLLLLSRQGFAVSKSITAILFVFLPKEGHDQATLDSCSGWVRHRGRFHESRTYTFILDTQLSKGDADVSLLDKAGKQLLNLNQQSPTGKINLDGKNRYYLYWKFKGATGKCILSW